MLLSVLGTQSDKAVEDFRFERAILLLQVRALWTVKVKNGSEGGSARGRHVLVCRCHTSCIPHRFADWAELCGTAKVAVHDPRPVQALVALYCLATLGRVAD